GNKKIIVTPGIVELGEQQEEVNYQFGEIIADHADIAILIGPDQTKPILQGIENKNDKIQIHTVRSLQEAQQLLQTIITTGDIVLFENDLPDTYNE
ncbi:MAG: UDP-N-acetylmuramoyl-tripeptide--D-alanyl-D-alanine ligase, partial [Spirochaetes bacterium]|nr:UDP-N-acetylmuramoyl-tripeptide--D-alanyl-D-alanine ligase [Spirochaetota bacterium]